MYKCKASAPILPGWLVVWVVWAPEGEKNKNETVRGRFRREIPTAAPPFLYLHKYIQTYIHTYIPTFLPRYVHAYLTYLHPVWHGPLYVCAAILFVTSPSATCETTPLPHPLTHPPTYMYMAHGPRFVPDFISPGVVGGGEGGGARRSRTHRLLHSDADLTSYSLSAGHCRRLRTLPICPCSAVRYTDWNGCCVLLCLVVSRLRFSLCVGGEGEGGVC